MAASFEQLATDTANLPRQQRLALAKLLLDLDQPGDSTLVAAEWDQEIRTRIKAIDEGRATAIPYEQIRQEMNSRYRSR